MLSCRKRQFIMLSRKGRCTCHMIRTKNIYHVLKMEYTFDFPLQISLDWRPAYSISGGGFYGVGFGLGVRYRF